MRRIQRAVANTVVGQMLPPGLVKGGTTVVAYNGWETIYAEAAVGLDVIDNVTDAVAWANRFITRTMN